MTGGVMSVPSRDDIKNVVVETFCKISDNPKIEEMFDIYFDVGIDSLDVAEVMMDIEDVFKITIEVEDIKDCNIVRDVVDVVCRIMGVK
jgi:acyl carrier protein